MARDYANKGRPTGKGAAAPKQKPAPKPRKAAKPKEKAPARNVQHGSLSLKWILSLAVVGCFIGFIVYLNTLPGGDKPSAPRPASTGPQTVEPPKPVKPAPKSTTAKQEEQRFRFYDMLPESEVATPEVNEYTPGPNMQDFDYIVQAGSFRNQKDAERMRAEIAFQGLRAHVQNVEQDNGSVWYRVNAGPFKSRSNMNSAVDKLVSIDIQPLVRKIPKEG